MEGEEDEERVRKERNYECIVRKNKEKERETQQVKIGKDN